MATAAWGLFTNAMAYTSYNCWAALISTDMEKHVCARRLGQHCKSFAFTYIDDLRQQWWIRGLLLLLSRRLLGMTLQLVLATVTKTLTLQCHFGNCATRKLSWSDWRQDVWPTLQLSVPSKMHVTLFLYLQLRQANTYAQCVGQHVKCLHPHTHGVSCSDNW